MVARPARVRRVVTKPLNPPLRKNMDARPPHRELVSPVKSVGPVERKERPLYPLAPPWLFAVLHHERVAHFGL